MSENSGTRKSAETTIAGEGEAANRPARAGWIGELAQAPAARLEALWRGLELLPRYERLRGPEIGLVMLRGRAGGSGEPFNVGEATAARCTVRLASGEIGHGYALGRDLRKAEISALLDALLQTAAAERIGARVLAPLAAERAARALDARRKAAATRVEFFTMTRGENE